MDCKQLFNVATSLLTAQNISLQKIAEEQDEEIDTMLMAADFDNQQIIDKYYMWPPSEPKKKEKIDLSELEKHLKKASEHVVVEDTLNEYQWYDSAPLLLN
ncbi:hypothetical protein A0H81_11679 [Grifola frondosa]|uniref:Uncharacterized protein n=1 Tax=Grifola frondosa TaxID=5627 RepID=A0A1C7LV51_GRIFR|nr:hypothetical protein A0H81_11679 [Grifola frondosa]